jgi:transposase, IS6 family
MDQPTDAISWHDPPSRQDDRWFGGPDRTAYNHIEADHGRLKARLRPMRGLKQDRSARVVIAGHGFVQNIRRGHYELAVEEPIKRRVAVAFNKRGLAI